MTATTGILRRAQHDPPACSSGSASATSLAKALTHPLAMMGCGAICAGRPRWPSELKQAARKETLGLPFRIPDGGSKFRDEGLPRMWLPRGEQAGGCTANEDSKSAPSACGYLSAPSIPPPPPPPEEMRIYGVRDDLETSSIHNCDRATGEMPLPASRTCAKHVRTGRMRVQVGRRSVAVREEVVPLTGLEPVTPSLRKPLTSGLKPSIS